MTKACCASPAASSRSLVGLSISNAQHVPATNDNSGSHRFTQLGAEFSQPQQLIQLPMKKILKLKLPLTLAPEQNPPLE